VLALAGAGYWSLVAGMVVSAAASAAGTILLAWPGLERVTRDVARSTLSFSADLVGSRLAWYWYANADFVVAGRVLGAAALGAYSFAWTIATIPIDKVGTVVARVALAFFSATQHDAETFRRDLLRLVEGLAVLTVPACIGLALVAQDLVEVLLGDRWLPAILPLQVLCVYAPIRTLLMLFPSGLMALGRQRFLLWNNVAAAVVMPFGFWLASRWGAPGIAAAWVVLYPFVALPQYLALSRAIDLSLLDYLRALRPAIVSTMIMAATLAAINSGISVSSQPVRLGVDVLAGVIAYGLSMVLLFRSRVTRILAIARTLRPTAPRATTSAHV
jgi:PST family polysaccharide transporter